MHHQDVEIGYAHCVVAARVDSCLKKNKNDSLKWTRPQPHIWSVQSAEFFVVKKVIRSLILVHHQDVGMVMPTVSLQLGLSDEEQERQFEMNTPTAPHLKCPVRRVFRRKKSNSFSDFGASKCWFLTMNFASFFCLLVNHWNTKSCAWLVMILD